MKNEVGDKSPNEVALSVLIEGDTFARQNKLHNRKNLRANPLVLFRLFLLSPKSLLCNTFRGPRKRFALFIGSDDLGAPIKAACRTRHALQCFLDKKTATCQENLTHSDLTTRLVGRDDLGAPVKAACRTRHALQCFSCQNKPLLVKKT